MFYFKIPQKVKFSLEENIMNIQKQINEAEKLKEDTKNTLSEHEKKISNSKSEIQKMLSNANDIAEKSVLKANDEFHLMITSSCH